MQEGRINSLGSWLEEKCKSERLSLRQAAAKTGLSHSTLANIRKGNTKVRGETIKKLARYFSGDGTRSRLVLEDRLLVLAGYRTERAEDEPSEPIARLMDTLSQFSKPKLKIIAHFAEFLAEMEKR